MDCIEILNSLGFKTKENTVASVFFVKDLHKLTNEIDVNVLLALESAKKFNVDAVYFRFFNDGRPPIPQIYIYDNTLGSFDSIFFLKKHKDIWSSCNVPAFLVIEKTSIKLYDACSPIKFKYDEAFTEPVENIDLSDIELALQRFNAALFDNGSFWEEEKRKNLFTNNKSASQRLVAGLRKLRLEFLMQTPLKKELSDKLLIICILIKYLEENGVDTSSENLASSFFKKATGWTSLVDVIRNNKITQLLKKLSEHFNGGIFSFSEAENREIDSCDLSSLANFFEAEYKNNLFGWREYSFEYIPVELISNFYEEFLDVDSDENDSKGVVYTPSFLVNLLIDEVLPLSRTKNLSENIKLMDPACGSGIFLVAAFRRLVQRWRINNIRKGQLANPEPNDLKRILSNNIFGVDINSNAVNLTIFSLQLALCSMLTPRQIWADLDNFDDLLKQKNIKHDDFLKTIIEDKQQKDFDLIIGNPPYYQNRQNISKYKGILQFEMNNPQSELSLLFAEKSMTILKPKGLLCLLLPSGPLLYNSSSREFRKDFFSRYNVTQIIDFIYFRRILFNGATVTTLALFAEKHPPLQEESIQHIIPKRTKVSKDKIFFELDYYDFYRVPKSYVLTELNPWKSNVIGGHLVYNLVQKITNQTNNFTEIKRISNLKIQGTRTKMIQEEYNNIVFFNREESLDIFPPKKTKFNYWTIKKTIKSDEDFPCEATYVDRSSDLITFISDKKTLQSLATYLKDNAKILRLFIAASSNRQAIRSPYTIDASDIKSLPYKENFKINTCDFISHKDKYIIDDFNKFYLELLGKGENAQINLLDAQQNDIIDFSNVLCAELNDIYKNGKKEYRLTKCLKGLSYFCCEYTYNSLKEAPVFEETKQDISDLLEHWNVSKTCRFERIVRIYESDKFIILKPRKLRYWLKSIALRDVADILKESING